VETKLLSRIKILLTRRIHNCGTSDSIFLGSDAVLFVEQFPLFPTTIMPSPPGTAWPWRWRHYDSSKQGPTNFPKVLMPERWQKARSILRIQNSEVTRETCCYLVLSAQCKWADTDFCVYIKKTARIGLKY